jgi:DNA polymerase III subunit alpha
MVEKSAYVHLRAHSQYSILDGSASIEDLVKCAKSYGMSALALTDHGNLFGVVEFYKACKDAKIASVIGCEFYVAPQSRSEKSRVFGHPAGYHLTLLAKNQQGYKNLCKLSSIGYLEGFYYYPRIDLELLKKYSEGLICIDGSVGTRLAKEITQSDSVNQISQLNVLRDLFKEDYYLDIQRHHMSEADLRNDGMYQESWLVQQYQEFIGRQEKVNEALIELSKQHLIPLVATNDVHYLEREDWRAHEILMNIQSGEPCEIWERDSAGKPLFRTPNPKRQTYSNHEYYFKSGAQMEALFTDVPEAIANTALIASQCHVEIDFKAKHYPVFVPPELENREYNKEEREIAVEKFLRNLCEEGISRCYTPERLAKVQEIYPEKSPLQVIRDRLEYEMSIIVPKGMADYLLIVWDFINWAKRNNIPMGPGRGSGAGSIVLYLIGITDIEPLRFHLFFERFINPERISYPDIDVDICMDRRGDVIKYTLEKYGKDNIAQIITFGTMKARMVIKDVGRVLSVPLTKVNEIVKLVPEDLNITLEKALEKEPDLQLLYQTDPEVTRLLKLALKLEGSIRNTGIHAAGIIISGEPLTDLIPICNAKDSEMPVTQFSMKPVESVGMLKVDFLGLKTLTAIQICVDAIQKQYGRKIDWVNLPLDDKPTFDMLNQGKTLGVFQLESSGMQDLARQLHLDKFEEIIAVGALYRPGPMDMIPSFINRKHGKEPIDYDHPWMKDILAETYGIMVYQEQVMQIASKLASYTLGEGDVLRRAMGKKDLEQMAQQREKFKSGAIGNGIDEAIAISVFDKMEKFASYGFNKSHAAAYGYLSYVTAYLKANYLGEWMAALMTCDRDDISKTAKFIREAKSLGISILPPDVNEAGSIFQSTPGGIRFAMTGIKGVGEGVVELIIQERDARGPFKGLYNFFKRMDSKKVGKKVVENLIEAGCFDFTGWSRDALKQSVDPIHEVVSKEHMEDLAGVISFFSMMGETSEKRFESPPVVKQKISIQEVLRREKELLGFFLTGHPMDEYKETLNRLSCVLPSHYNELDNGSVFRSAFIVETVQVRTSAKTQRKFAILEISDGLERYELPVWSDLFDEKSSLLRENQLLYAVLQLEEKEGERKLSCRWLNDLTKADEEMIQACDQAYDKFKHQAVKFAQYRQNPKTLATPSKQQERSMTPKKEGKEDKIVNIQLDLNQLKMSHLFALKQLFMEHRGASAVKIDFFSEKQLFATIYVDANQGVVNHPELHSKIMGIISFAVIG